MKCYLLIFIALLLDQNTIFSQVVISADSLKNHVYTLANDSFEGRSIGTKGGDKASQYIVEQFKSIGIKPLLSDYYHHFTYHNGALTAEGKNVIGIIEGSNAELKNEYIVIGAHYDHVGYKVKNGEKIVYNGADDNASGVATIIEVGRAILNNRSQFERSIILIAFDGEETGLNGSKWFINDSIIPPTQIKLMMSVDMVGMLSKNEGIELYGTSSLKNSNRIAEQTAAKINLIIKKDAKAVSARADTKSFGDARIPAIHIFTGTVSPYHKPEDDADLLDYQGMAKISEFIYEFTLYMAVANSSQLVSTLSADGKPPIFKLGARLNTGASFHNYPNEYYRSNSGLALQAGLYAHINLAKRLALQPEVLYETLGCQSSDGDFRTHAITTPVNVLIRLAGIQEMDVWSYFVVGAYYTYNFAGNVGNTAIDYSALYDPYEYGVNIGLALNISNVQVGVTRKIGLTNLYQDNAEGNAKNDALFFTMGLQF